MAVNLLELLAARWRAVVTRRTTTMWFRHRPFIGLLTFPLAGLIGLSW